MADAPKILGTDSLKQTYPKLNQAIDNANEALSKSTTAELNSTNAVSTANEANTKSDTTQAQLDTIILESGTSDAETLQARGTFPLLYNRLDDLNAQLAQKVYNSTYYNPLKQEAAINPDLLKASDIYAMFDNLMTQYPSYITRTLLGNDSTGTLPIYRYDFKPLEPSLKMILGANLHGNGIDGDSNDTAVTLFNLMREITKNFDKDSKLFFMRWKVHFIVIPVQNPWGFNNSKRQNGNGVDLNRNFDWKWEEYTANSVNPWDMNYKGTAPFSEKESQYIRDILLANRDAVAYIDYHSVAGSTSNRWHYAGQPSTISKTTQKAKDLSVYLNSKYAMTSTIDGIYSDYPMSFCYAESLGITAGNPEFIVFSDGITAHSADQMTKMLEWYGNFPYLIAYETFMGINQAPKCSVYYNANQPLTSGANTLLKWNSSLFDIGHMLNPKYPTRITAPDSGYYEITFTIPFATNTAGVRQVFMRKNESGANWINTYKLAAMPSGQTVVTGVAFEYLNAGDFIELQAVQTSGVTLDVIWDTGNGYGAKLGMRKVN